MAKNSQHIFTSTAKVVIATKFSLHQHQLEVMQQFQLAK